MYRQFTQEYVNTYLRKTFIYKYAGLSKLRETGERVYSK